MHWTFFEVDESFVKYRDTRKIISLDALCFSCLTFRVILRHTTEGIVRVQLMLETKIFIAKYLSFIILNYLSRNFYLDLQKL